MGLFGSITRTLFGGSKKTDESGNRFGDQINSQFSPWVSTGGQGLGAAASILGLNGSEAGKQALDSWWGGSGGDFLLNKGLDDVDAFYRQKGLGQSGAAMKGIEDYRSGLASTKLGEAMQQLFSLSQLGLGAGGLIADAGRYSKGKATSNEAGLGAALGAILASDPRLKTAVEKLGELADGLGVYAFDYLPADGAIAAFMPQGRQVGVMADEVAQLRPWALGPEIEGYATVDYAKLEAA